MAWMGSKCSHPPYSISQRRYREILDRMVEGSTRGCSYGQAKGLCPGKLLSDHMRHNCMRVIPVLMDRESFIAPSWGPVRTDD